MKSITLDDYVNKYESIRMERQNVLSFVHVEELADLYVFAVKKAPPLSLYNVESNEATMKQIASVVSRAVGLGGSKSKMES